MPNTALYASSRFQVDVTWSMFSTVLDYCYEKCQLVVVEERHWGWKGIWCQKLSEKHFFVRKSLFWSTKQICSSCVTALGSSSWVVLINWSEVKIKKMWELAVACFLFSPILSHRLASHLAPAQPPNLKTESVSAYNMMITYVPELVVVSRYTWWCSNSQCCQQYWINV